MEPKRISVIGVGLLGGSIGLAVKAAGIPCRITGYGHRASTVAKALEMGAIDEAAGGLADAAAGSDLVILCTPVGLFEEILREIGQALTAGTMVTDVGSTKRSVVRLAEQLVPEGVHFVGSHPMAGSEKRGVEFARADLFAGAQCILTPTPTTDPAALEAIDGFWRRLGMRTCRMSLDEHDRLVCDISHLPHAVAAALVAMQSEEALTLVGNGFLDTTRIAAGDGGLWRDILLDNRDNLRQAIGRLRAKMDELIGLLEAGKEEEVRRWLDAAAELRQQVVEQRLREGGEG
jgi:prephenate dehydrogenase